MIEIDIAIEEGDWPDHEALEGLTKGALSTAETHLPDQLPADAEVSFVFTNDEQVQALNRQWREQDKPTNVLSFASNEGGGPITPLLGDIVLAFETIKREAAEQNKPFDDHLSHLCVHGFLHLLGYDHLENEEANAMEGLETTILSSMGISDPYA